ncbi:nicotinamide riboside transporter PnuC [Marinilactibacillus kalidii]|uniref:nicotinamide riboside transporter PnuC n=1 Tax=Marinilactibacillus kalidii TaxID=2820274 RepID=UPI001ABEAF56|nr:nicotinamide riboside transporter PnuC [Marinilactibacillus kalidii]
MLSSIKNELFMGYDKTQKIFYPALILLQIVVFFITRDNPIGVITGLAGIIAVIMAAKGRISTAYFGFVQVSGYLYLSIQANLPGEVMLNIFYLVSQFVVFYTWKNNRNKAELTDKAEEVESIKITRLQWVYNILGMVVTWIVFTKFLEFMGGSNPPVDSITTTMSVFAQIHMIKRLSSQWVLWILVNGFTVYLWFLQGNVTMVAMWTGMLLNSIYAWYIWDRKARKGNSQMDKVIEAA